MINGVHAILYSHDAGATRATLAKVLGTRSVDAGGGWLIFALPPAELAVHPAEEGGRAELYLMTDDVAATVTALQAERSDRAHKSARIRTDQQVHGLDPSRVRPERDLLRALVVGKHQSDARLICPEPYRLSGFGPLSLISPGQG